MYEVANSYGNTSPVRTIRKPINVNLPRHVPMVSEPSEALTKLTNPRFIDPLSDYGFKRLFGKPANKKFLIAFLNSLLKKEVKIRNIDYRSPERIGPVEGSKKIIYDILCVSESGKRFIVEMQRAYQVWFKNRMLFYNCCAIEEQLTRGKELSSYDKLNQTYSISLLEFTLPDSPPDEYIHDVCNCYWKSKELFHNKQWYKFIELPKFNKQINELTTDLEKWLYLLKNMKNMQSIPTVLNTGIFREVFEHAEISNLSRKEYNMIRLSHLENRNFESALEYARQEAAKKAEVETMKKAEKAAAHAAKKAEAEAAKKAEKAAAQAAKKAKEEATAVKQKQFATRLIQQTKLSDQRIAELTDLEVSRIQSLRKGQKGV